MIRTTLTADLEARLDALAGAADAVAAPLADAALRSTTLGRERAVLRLIGVSGLDREGRPLAAETVDRYVAGDRARLSRGVALPFAMALLVYDTSPQDLALDVSAGSVDLALEAEVLEDPERRASATNHLRALVDAAAERIAANRVARRELLGVLGDPPMPWIGATLREQEAEDAAGEAATLARAGLDLVRVDVPAGRELATRLAELGQDVRWRPRSSATGREPAPSGSQRGLTRLRDLLDRTAAERGGYIRLSIAPTALGAPEGAVVAAFERADVIDTDPMAEIVSGGIDPARALADFVLCVRLCRAAGVVLQLGPGPLVVAPDLARGVNSDAPSRSGRALALQLVAAAVARRTGLAEARLLLGALPSWLGGDPDPAARAVAEVAVRRHLHPRHDLAFVEPAGDEPSAWPTIAGAALPGSGAGVMLRRVRAGMAPRDIVIQARAAGQVARELEDSLGPGVLGGVALAHAVAMADAGIDLLGAFERQGWSAIIGDAGERGGHLGADSVTPLESGVLEPLARVLDEGTDRSA